MVVIKLYLSQKIELKLNKTQINDFENYFGYSRYIYNKSLEVWKNMYMLYKEDKKNNKTPNKRNVRDIVKSLREDWEYELPTMILETSVEDLGNAYRNYFERRSKFPNFKKKDKCKKSIRFYKKNEYSLRIINDNRLRLQGLNYTLRMKEHLKLDGDIKEVTISNVNNKYYASITVKVNVDDYFKIDNELYCGIDLGIKDLAIISGDDGLLRKYHSLISKLKPLYLKTGYYNKLMSRKVRGSNKYNKTRVKLNSTYERIKNIRNDYLNKITSNIVQRYKYICIEDLNVSGMIKNRHLSKSIGESCWYTFREMLVRKASLYDNIVIVADRFFPSTQLCSNCGHRFIGDEKMTLKQRLYKCPDCKTIIDRDFNASINLKEYGRRFIGMANEGNN